MKKIIEKFIKRQKKVLVLMGISLSLFLLNLFIMLLVILSKQEAINEFLLTSKITNDILPVTLLGFTGMGLGIFFLITVMIFMFKFFIPDNKTFGNLMMKDEISFLIDIPSKIREEVQKNGK